MTDTVANALGWMDEDVNDAPAEAPVETCQVCGKTSQAEGLASRTCQIGARVHTQAGKRYVVEVGVWLM